MKLYEFKKLGRVIVSPRPIKGPRIIRRERSILIKGGKKGWKPEDWRYAEEDWRRER